MTNLNVFMPRSPSSLRALCTSCLRAAIAFTFGICCASMIATASLALPALLAAAAVGSLVGPRDPARTTGRDHFPHMGPLDWFWTELTGDPRSDAEQWFRHTPWSRLLLILCPLVGGPVLGFFAWSTGGILLLTLPLSWLATVNAARRCQIEVFHHAVHCNLTGHKTWDRNLGEAISLLLFIQDWDSYAFDHVDVHHSKKGVTSTEDADWKVLSILGFAPGMPSERCWEVLASALTDFRLDALFLRARFRASFGSVSSNRRARAFGTHGSILALVIYLEAWIPFLVVWVFPLTFLYHRSALLQFASEHRWLAQRKPGENGRVFLHRLTSARRQASVPPTGGSLVSWLIWWIILPVHLWARLFVVVGDLPGHDWHHVHATGDWANTAWERARVVRGESRDKFSHLYSEVWGLHNALGEVFTSLEALPAIPASESSQEDVDDVFLGM